ncbi:sodium channel protein Nach-like [Zerene cesonia]|uniref:sodium channel protein Nach-like n=1 Tax=Zerene cesonia TaxID=33412 RepID=UPI0018E528F8|nr:sodium channel protein Nach-like [Zerene cesonia]
MIQTFWLIFVSLSWYCSSLLIAAQYRAFLNNPISFVVETTYTDWNTNFPTIAICESDNTARIEEISDGIWGKDHDFNIEEVLKELAFYKGVAYYTSEFCNAENALSECFADNITYYVNLIRSNCNEIISNCSWNGISFDCCKYFRPMDTEFGVCFAINTIQGRERHPPRLELVSNRTTGPGAMMFNVLVPGRVFVLNEEEVPSITTPGSDIMNVGPEIYRKRLISIKDIANDAGARLISPEKRKCRYTDENILDVYPHYSYTACTVQCRKNAQLRTCNCTNFYMPNIEEHLKCNVLRARWSSRIGLFCDCLPSCTEAEISIVKDLKKPIDDNYARIEIELAFLPSERYRRNVVRGALDLVVSTGGTGGLFLGASILSFVELIYIILIRPFCNIYARRNEDPWHKKFGRKLEENKFGRRSVKFLKRNTRVK